MILLIDNYDSFTYNLFQQIENLGCETRVYPNDKITAAQIKKLNPEKIVISPGPGRPDDAGISMEVIQEFYKEIPILGVCLGHQSMGQVFGSSVVESKKILHGKTSNIYHKKDGLFSGIKSPFVAARYHSLVLETTPRDFALLAWTKNNEIMAIRHNGYPLFGVQFHPESFLTKNGDELMKNFLYEI